MLQSAPDHVTMLDALCHSQINMSVYCRNKMSVPFITLPFVIAFHACMALSVFVPPF